MIDINELRSMVLDKDKSAFPAGKMLACVARKGNQSWIGLNSRKSHPLMFRKFKNGQENSCCHAEVSAVLQVPRQCRSLIYLYVVRFLKNGDVTMARPCGLCRRFLQHNNINFNRVFYTDWNWNGQWKRLDCSF